MLALQHSIHKRGLKVLTVEEIKVRLSDRNLKAVAEKCEGVGYRTVLKLAKGSYKKISYDSVKMVSDYLEAQEADLNGI